MGVHLDEPATKGDLGQLKQELSAKIDANAVKIEENGRKIDANSATLSRVSRQVAENHEQIEKLLTMSATFEEYFHEVISSLDGLASGFARLEQEKTAMNARFDRVEEDVEKNKSDITEIKAKLALP